MLATDAALAAASFYLANLIRFDFFYEPDLYWRVASGMWPWAVGIKLLCFWFFGLYRGMWRYTSLAELLDALKAVVASSLILVTGVLMVHRFQDFSRAFFVIDGLLTFLFVGGVRVAVRIWFSKDSSRRFGFLSGRVVRPGDRRLLIVGAGDAAEKVVREIQAEPELKLFPVGFLDDDPDRRGKWIHGVPVLGPVDDLGVLPLEFDEILIAWPEASSADLRRVVERCEGLGKAFRTLPAMGELINGRISVRSVRQVKVEDLLGRAELNLDQAEIARYLKDRRVLVTGAGGSIGSELSRWIGRFAPRSVGLLEVSELNLFQADMEWRQRFPDIDRRLYLTDVRDRSAVERALDDFGPEVVFHAAAYKHVPMQEQFPWEAVANNVVGTRNVAQTALERGVDRFVLVSTDKAVRPTNVMGATKRVAELYVQCACGSGSTRFMAVRFGNVLESSGSAVPVFRSQITRGGPVTVTHPEVTRYFMSVGEAAQLILQAGALGRGGEIFILKMGRPIRILDLVRDMIRLHGYEPDRDIRIEFTGLRPGEKLTEELITEGEGIVPSAHEKIMVLRGGEVDMGWLDERVAGLVKSARRYDAEGIRTRLKEIVPEYRPGGGAEA
jgi:FlaA1/EpsC-like NDP-sugar epimerase